MNLFIAGTDFACALISIVILCAILSTKEQKKQKNRPLIWGIIFLVFFSAADGASFIMDDFRGNDVIHFYTNLFSYIGADFIISAFVYYITERIREQCDFSKVYARIVFAGSFLDVLYVVYGAYSGALYRIENGKTVYGVLNNYLGIAQFVVVVYFLCVVFIHRKHLEKKFAISVALYFLPPIIAMIIVLINEQLIFTYVAALVAFLIVYVVVIQEDLHASIIGEKIMRKASITDGLSGVLNRKAYSEDVVLFDDQYPSDFVYMSLDVNGLKVVNDSLGHEAGDEIILGASQCMQKCFSSYGKIYRMGGDEFTIILHIDKYDLETVVSEFENEVKNWKGKLVDSLSVSFGYVTVEDIQGLSIFEVASVADKRMYETKSAYYKKKGIDRRGQADAHRALCNLYTKILKINITDDTYSIVNMDVSEQTKEKGFAENSISEWLRSFGESGQVYEEDLEDYLRYTNIDYMRDYFAGNKTSLHIFYRRKFGDEFKQVMMEIIPADDYSNDNQSLFLYVNNIEK